MSRRIRLLAIDDEPEMLRMLSEGLSVHGFDVTTCADALSGIRATYQTRPDAVLLDVTMDGMDGFEVCRRLREMTSAPIIFVTASGFTDDVVRGLSLGANDYLVKPIRCAELASRVAACLRRAEDGADDQRRDFVFPASSVFLDSGRHEIVFGERAVYLAPREFEVIRLLARHSGTALSAAAILSRVWGAERIGETELVKHYIHRLRQKIECDPRAPEYIRTVRGEGYYFDPHS
ncbi:MAG: response regulator transcription factor [Chloroflexi bacterium]|nr:response regulator transcription factor [Chloroflexota bacterium]